MIGYQANLMDGCSTPRAGVQVLLGHVKRSDGNRGTSEISDGDKRFAQHSNLPLSVRAVVN